MRIKSVKYKTKKIYFVNMIVLFSINVYFRRIKLYSIMDFRIRIKELCQSKGITQKELADKMGISDISLNKTLRGDYPQLQTLERIANALEVDITELFMRNTADSEVNGYVKVKGTLYEVHSFEDLEKLIKLKK